MGGLWGWFFYAWQAHVPAANDLAYPEFDAVSGVSTGGLMSPFALIGTPERLQEAEDLYRHSSPDWVKLSTWSAISKDESLADTTGLDAMIRQQIDLSLAQELYAETVQKNRVVSIGSSDADLGRPFT